MNSKTYANEAKFQGITQNETECKKLKITKFAFISNCENYIHRT